MKKQSLPRNIIFGAHAVLAALKNSRRKCHELLVSKGLSPEIETAVQARSDLKIVKISTEELDKLLGEETVHQGIALRVAPLQQPFLEDILESTKETSCVLILDQVTDPHNVGAIMRSAAAFGVDALIYQSMNAPDANNSTLIKAASGAVEFLPMVEVTNLARTMEALKNAGFWCYGLDETGTTSISDEKLSQKIALVLGREGKGLRPLTRDTCDALIHLPTASRFSTLNVSNAAAVALYEWRRQNAIKD